MNTLKGLKERDGRSPDRTFTPESRPCLSDGFDVSLSFLSRDSREKKQSAETACQDQRGEFIAVRARHNILLLTARFTDKTALGGKECSDTHSLLSEYS